MWFDFPSLSHLGKAHLKDVPSDYPNLLCTTTTYRLLNHAHQSTRRSANVFANDVERDYVVTKMNSAIKLIRKEISRALTFVLFDFL